MKTFSIEQLKRHFVGVPYSTQSVFYSLLLQYNVIERIARGKYVYNFNNLDDKDLIQLIILECKDYVNKPRS
jgi:hypothetical protein